MKKTILLTAAALLTLGACKNNSKFPGFDETSGAYFKIEKASGKNSAINKGDVVFMRYDILTDKDSMLFNYKTMSQPGRPLAVRIGESAYKGDMFEMMLKMHEGDSVSFAIRVDSIFKKSYHQPIPKYLDSTGFIVYHIKVDSVYSSQKVEDIEKKQKAAQAADLEKRKNEEEGLIKTYLTDNKITEKPTTSGLYIIVKEKGKGPKAKVGEMAEVKYKGMFTNGQVFDETKDKPYPVGVGMKQVIAAWDEVLQTMSVGTKVVIVTPASLAYGETGFQGIPPFTPLVFEMQVVKISPAGANPTAAQQ